MYIISIKLAGTEKAGLEVELFEFENNRSESTLGLTMSALLFRSICSVIPVPFSADNSKAYSEVIKALTVPTLFLFCKSPRGHSLP